MTTETYEVTGMTCDHCVRSVMSEVAKVDGVVAVAVDLSTGIVSVTSDEPIDCDELSNAVTEAGYELTT
jgi:copper chaperone